MRFAAGVATATLTVLTLVACSSDAGTPVPSSDNNSASSTSTDSSQNHSSTQGTLQSIPVDKPLDASQYLAHACKLLSTEQAKKLGGDPSSAKLDSGSPSSCFWSSSDSGGSFSIGWITKYPKGIARLKQAEHKAPTFDQVKDLTVGGYPALATFDNGNKQSGTCGVSVGINSHVILDVSIQGSTSSDPCHGATVVAKNAIHTMAQ